MDVSPTPSARPDPGGGSRLRPDVRHRLYWQSDPDDRRRRRRRPHQPAPDALLRLRPMIDEAASSPPIPPLHRVEVINAGQKANEMIYTYSEAELHVLLAQLAKEGKRYKGRSSGTRGWARWMPSSLLKPPWTRATGRSARSGSRTPTRRGDFRPPLRLRRRAPQRLHHCRLPQTWTGSASSMTSRRGEGGRATGSLRRGAPPAHGSQPSPRCFDSFISPMRQGRPDSDSAAESGRPEQRRNIRRAAIAASIGLAVSLAPPAHDNRNEHGTPACRRVGNEHHEASRVAPGGRGCQRQHPRCQHRAMKPPPSTSSANCGLATPVRQTFPYDLYDTVGLAGAPHQPRSLRL